MYHCILQVLVPVNIPKLHWLVAEVDLSKSCIRVYDSWKKHLKTAQVRTLMQPLSNIIPHIFTKLIGFDAHLDLQQIKVPWPIERIEVNQQTET